MSYIRLDSIRIPPNWLTLSKSRSFRNSMNNSQMLNKLLSKFFHSFLLFYILLCVHRKKVVESQILAVFDRFTQFGMSWTRFDSVSAHPKLSKVIKIQKFSQLLEELFSFHSFLLFTFFYVCIARNWWNNEYLQFLIDLRKLECPEHDWTASKHLKLSKAIKFSQFHE